MDDNRLEEPIARYERDTKSHLDEYERLIAAWFFYEGVEQTASKAAERLTEIFDKGESANG